MHPSSYGQPSTTIGKYTTPVLEYENAVEALKYRDLTYSADFTKQHKNIRKNTQGQVEKFLKYYVNK